jgi:hypothetical protein
VVSYAQFVAAETGEPIVMNGSAMANATLLTSEPCPLAAETRTIACGVAGPDTVQ